MRITSSASGHLAVGEDYATAAVRELEEELDCGALLDFAAKFPASAETANEHTYLYIGKRTDATPVPDSDEIAELEWVSSEEVTRRMVADREDFTPPFRVLFEWCRRQAVLAVLTWNRTFPEVTAASDLHEMALLDLRVS
ncbi:MAG: NUDIX domain-containing protein [Planctomycetaceae bacterium]